MTRDEMIYSEYRPHPLLAKDVQLIWIFELDQPTSFGPPERIVADGIVEAVFHFGTPFLMAFGDGMFARQPRSFALSQTSRAVRIQPEGKSGFVSVRFHPWGAHHFFDLPVSEFADSVIDAKDLWGSAAAALEERIALSRDNGSRFAIVQEFLLDRLQDGGENLSRWVAYVRSRAGQVSLKEMTRELGVSERHLERKLKAALGMSPKRLLRITRFLRACGLLRERRFGSLTDLAHHCGYYDQAHFIHDFREFSGLTPSEFVAESRVSFLEWD